jgi:TRAP-type C4-dicarboxylate transport system permease small subunit
MKKYFIHFISLLLILGPFMLLADSSLTTIKNPLGEGNDNVDSILLKIMNIVAMVGGIVVVFFIIFSGFKLVTAGSNEGNRTKAKEMFYATIIGGAVLLGADIIANVVVGTIDSIKK